ncbi:MAG: hypothetical protein GC134_09530 [Proteobacteria bacterium]|nr:hypothetical protein [Pseudomonadota bacterium]
MTTFLALLFVAAWIALLGWLAYNVMSPYRVVCAHDDHVTFRHKTNGNVTCQIMTGTGTITDVAVKSIRPVGRHGSVHYLSLKPAYITPVKAGSCIITVPDGATLKSATVSTLFGVHTGRVNFLYGNELLVAEINLPA